MKKNLNQKLINLIEYYNLINTNLLLSEKPLKRNSKKTITTFGGTKLQKLNKLRNNIQLIKNCLLKKFGSMVTVIRRLLTPQGVLSGF